MRFGWTHHWARRSTVHFATARGLRMRLDHSQEARSSWLRTEQITAPSACAETCLDGLAPGVTACRRILLLWEGD